MPSLAEKQRLFTAEEYHEMAQAGILTEDDRVELIDGQVIAMSPIGSRHIACVNRLTYLFTSRLYASKQPAAIVSVQNPVRLGRHQEPEPDLALLKPPGNPAQIPQASDVLLLVEVADSSLAFDQEVKIPRYAEAGIPEVWIVTLEHDGVEVYRNPGGQAYADVSRYLAGDVLLVEALPGMEAIPIVDMLET